ncbi:MAG TPA: MOSC domain-containing protein, partial [Solirubrobacteraceae bacterium]
MSVATATSAPAGRLVSLNVGGPRDVPWEGKTVRTAIWKEPVDGPRMVRRINIDGDDQADRAAHGGEHRAVYVYQLDSYRYWEQQLERSDFTYGQFGENFTVEGLADDEVCIGDRYRIGGAIFEVTQPRVTCFRLGIRMEEPRMPSLLVAHHRPGFYLRVLEEGPVQAGDAITRLGRGPEQLSVADVDGLLYLPHRSHRTLERALRIPALSEGWKGSFRALLEQNQTAAAEPAPPAWPGFAPLTVTAIARESATITSFTLAPVDSVAPAPGAVSSGQYLTLRLRPGGPDGPEVIRSYSLSCPAGRDGYRISVKREAHGAGSAFL